MSEQTLEKPIIKTYEMHSDGFVYTVTISTRYGSFNWKSTIKLDQHIVETSSGMGGTYKNHKQAFDLLKQIQKDFTKYDNDKEFKELKREFYT